MKNPSYLALSRHNIYYFRWPLPQEVRQKGKTAHIKISLQTREPKEALHLAALLQVYAYNHAYKPSPVSFYKVLPAIVERMLWQGGLNKTQLQLLQDVQEQFPNAKLRPNLWNRALLPLARRKVQTLIDGNMMHPISVRECKTLADIRKLLKAKEQRKGAVRTFKQIFIVGREKLMVGDKIYPYIIRTSGKKKQVFVQVTVKAKSGTKRHWLHLQALLSLVAAL